MLSVRREPRREAPRKHRTARTARRCSWLLAAAAGATLLVVAALAAGWLPGLGPKPAAPTLPDGPAPDLVDQHPAAAYVDEPEPEVDEVTARERYFPAEAGRPLEQLPRLGPDRLAKWLRFAEEKKCSTRDADYIQIFRDLEPFRRAGGVGAGAVAATLRLLRSKGLATLSVKAGRATIVEPERGQGRPPHYRVPFWQDLLSEFERDLPDMEAVLNLLDEPRSWDGLISGRLQGLLDNGTVTVRQAWHAQGCDGVRGVASLRHRHGFLQSTLLFQAERGLLPVFSGSKIEGCFADILIPTAQNNAGWLNDAALNSGCPISKLPWEGKKSKGVWRGSTTGGQVHELMSHTEWQGYHRQRLVDLSKEHPGELDAGFTSYIQCAEKQCAAMKARYGLAPHLNHAQLFSHKYQVEVDGNAAPSSLLPALCSGTLTLSASLMREWYYTRMVPYRHFVPVNPDYSDLIDRIQWARQNDAAAKGMAASAARLVNERLRRADWSCYLYRLLLEYGALYRGEVPGGLRVPDPPSPPPPAVDRDGNPLPNFFGW